MKYKPGQLLLYLLLLSTLPTHAAKNIASCISPNGKFCAVLDDTKNITIYDTANLESKIPIEYDKQAHPVELTWCDAPLAFSHDCTKIFVLTNNGSLLIKDFAKNTDDQKLECLKIGNPRTTCLCFGALSNTELFRVTYESIEKKPEDCYVTHDLTNNLQATNHQFQRYRNQYYILRKGVNKSCIAPNGNFFVCNGPDCVTKAKVWDLKQIKLYNDDTTETSFHSCWENHAWHSKYYFCPESTTLVMHCKTSIHRQLGQVFALVFLNLENKSQEIYEFSNEAFNSLINLYKLNDDTFLSVTESGVAKLTKSDLKELTPESKLYDIYHLEACDNPF